MTLLPLSFETMWFAVTKHDSAYDGQFVYGVKSTGIFCKPSCASRRPHPANVEFFADCTQAQQAGYRPCKRCQPEQRSAQTELVEAVCAYIEAHAANKPIRLNELGTQFHMSPHHLQRVFKSLTGVTPRQYAEAIRLQALKDELQRGSGVLDAIYGAGYGSTSRVYENTERTLGMTPKTYQRAGAQQTITYAIASSSLGLVLAASTPRGLCAVRIGDSAGQLIDELTAEFSAADLVEDAGTLTEALTAIIEHLDGERPHLDLPLDVQGTAFQKRVWDALREIPYGETRTYAEIAAAIGQPTASRAVGGACASNPVALVVPCHRVVRADGETGSYRWGAARKQKILEQERTTHPDKIG